LVEKTSQPRDRDPANGIPSGTNGTASGTGGTGGTGEGRRASGYGAVTNKRASIVIRRQSLAAGKEKEKEEERKEEEEPAIQSIDLKTAVRIIGLIEERQHDVNAFVRSAALRVLVSLVEGGFVPLSKFLSVTRVAAERLQDKGVLVRKNAMNLLTTVLVNNPYEGSLNAALYQQKIAELEALLQTFTPQNGENSAVSPSEQEEQQKTQRLLDYYSSAAQFTAVITDSVATVSLLLNSSTEGDVLAALHFLPLAAAFSIKGIDKALRRMNLLVWGASPAVMKELVA
ncbi:hypothetical protein WA577_003257, partial [Blastocystis sp. JDR]